MKDEVGRLSCAWQMEESIILVGYCSNITFILSVILLIVIACMKSRSSLYISCMFSASLLSDVPL